MERAVKVYIEHLSDFVDQAVDRVLAAKIPLYAGMPREALRAAIARAFAAVAEDLTRGTTATYSAYLGQVGIQRAQHGAPINQMMIGLDHGFQVVSDHFEQAFADDLPAQLWWAERRREIGDSGFFALTDAFYTARDATIAEQHAQLLRLSAPIIPLHVGVLMLPLVGTLDEARAQRVIHALLDGVARHRSEVVILDITGVPFVDEAVAGHLVHAAQAARLLGAQVILVGIGPTIAATIVQTGINLGGITILANLEKGVEYALRLRGLAIMRCAPGAPSA